MEQYHQLQSLYLSTSKNTFTHKFKHCPYVTTIVMSNTESQLNKCAPVDTAGETVCVCARLTSLCVTYRGKFVLRCMRFCVFEWHWLCRTQNKTCDKQTYLQASLLSNSWLFLWFWSDKCLSSLASEAFLFAPDLMIPREQ